MLRILRRNKIELYVDPSGKSPFKKWIGRLKDRRGIERIESRVERVCAGNLGDYRYVGEGVFELRIDYGPGYRLYFSQKTSGVIIILYGGDKSTQEKDIKKAQTYWTEEKEQENEKYPI